MTLTLDTTVSGANANSYASQAEADAYLESNLEYWTVWDALDDQAQFARLIEATRSIDRMNFVGGKVQPTQALKFPLSVQLSDIEEPATDVPQQVKDAQLEMIVHLWVVADATTGQAGQPVRKVDIKPIMAVEFDFAAVGLDSSTGGNLATVKALLREWLIGDAAIPVNK